MSDKFITHFDVSASGLTAERTRMRIIASNIANVNSTNSVEGGPYKRQAAVLESFKVPNSGLEQGVHIKEIVTDTSAPRLVYDPEHPDANAQGYVAYPNVNLVKEVTDMKTATMAYQANITAINATKQVISRSLDIGR